MSNYSLCPDGCYFGSESIQKEHWYYVKDSGCLVIYNCNGWLIEKFMLEIHGRIYSGQLEVLINMLTVKPESNCCQVLHDYSYILFLLTTLTFFFCWLLRICIRSLRLCYCVFLYLTIIWSSYYIVNIQIINLSVVYMFRLSRFVQLSPLTYSIIKYKLWPFYIVWSYLQVHKII